MIYNASNINNSCGSFNLYDTQIICIDESAIVNGTIIQLEEASAYFSGPIEEYQINFENGTFPLNKTNNNNIPLIEQQSDNQIYNLQYSI